LNPSSLQSLFEPRSVAAVGASANPGKAGYFLLRNILDGGYQGEVYPVNPHAGRLLGCRSYSTIREVPKPIDLAFLVVSKPQVKRMLLECAERKVKAVAIVTAGFAETGSQGAGDQRELQAIIQAGGMRALGPNSVGFINASRKLVGSFVPFRTWPEGPVAIAAQTGVFAGAYADELSAESTQRIGFSKSICFGNKTDVDEADFLSCAGEDQQTRVIALHLESLKRPREFLAAASRVKRAKPIVVLKTGSSEEGARATASHSGSLASSDQVVDAAFRQYGIVRAESLQDLMGITKAFAWQPLPRGNRVGIVTFSGALAVMALDQMQDTGLELARFSPATIRKIGALLPPWQPVQNPADVWMALASGPRLAHEQILDAVISDPQVDLMLAVLLPIPNADFTAVPQVFRKIRGRQPRKPIFLVVLGGQAKQRWLAELEALSFPNFPEPKSAVMAMNAMCFYAENRSRNCLDPLWRSRRNSHERIPQDPRESQYHGACFGSQR